MIDFKKNEIFAITKPKCHLFSAGLITLSAHSKSNRRNGQTLVKKSSWQRFLIDWVKLLTASISK
jgi:hypothetical protein